MNFLFWNTRKNNLINNYLIDTIIDYDCNVIILAEYVDTGADLCNKLSLFDKDIHEAPDIACSRIKMFFDASIQQEIITETSYYTIRNIVYRQSECLLAALHLPSQLHNTDDEIEEKTRELANDIENSENIVGHSNTIIVGDFNANPFAKALTSANCLHSLSSREVVNKESREVAGTKYKMFYNPMWNLFGDFDSPSGTYYYRKANLNMYFWNIFDQVILRPNILKYFVNDSLRILTENKKVSFVNRQGIPKKNKISDHLPIFFEIREEFFL